jgi:hypothetical protein
MMLTSANICQYIPVFLNDAKIIDTWPEDLRTFVTTLIINVTIITKRTDVLSITFITTAALSLTLPWIACLKWSPVFLWKIWTVFSP